LRGYSLVPSQEVFLHAGKSADIFAEHIRIGYVGELNPQVIEKLDIKVHKPHVVVFEIDLDHLIPLLEQKIVYRQIPKYPAIERDVALIIDDAIQADDVLKLFSVYQSDLIEQVELFDCYKGKNIPQDKKSLGVRVTYRGLDRTLTEAELEPVHLGLIEFIGSKTGARIRGTE